MFVTVWDSQSGVRIISKRCTVLNWVTASLSVCVCVVVCDVWLSAAGARGFRETWRQANQLPFLPGEAEPRLVTVCEMRRWSIRSLWSSVDLSQQEQRWLEVRLIDRKQQQNFINISISAFPEICWPFVQGAACDD